VGSKGTAVTNLLPPPGHNCALPGKTAHRLKRKRTVNRAFIGLDIGAAIKLAAKQVDYKRVTIYFGKLLISTYLVIEDTAGFDGWIYICIFN